MESLDEFLEFTVEHISRYAYSVKTRLTIERVLTRLIKDLYKGEIDQFDFVDRASAMIYEQLWKAVVDAGRSLGVDTTLGGLSAYDLNWVQEMVNEQYLFLAKLASEIVAAREAGKPVDPFLARVSLWGQLWERARSRALLTFAKANQLFRWLMGPTKEHCSTCFTLHGQIATAEHWRMSGFRPQGNMLECGGWHCLCGLYPLSDEDARKLTESGWVSQIPYAE